MKEHNQGISPQEGTKRREPLSDQQIGEALAGFGNHEGKALLVCKMGDPRGYLNTQLDKLISVDGKKPWSSSLAAWWCTNSLIPNGLVEREHDPQKGSMVYKRTKKGEELVAFAGHVLSFSEKHTSLALSRLLGSSNTAKKHDEEAGIKKSSPLTRFRIFSELVTRRLPIRQEDVIAALCHDYPGEYKHDAHATIGNHLTILAEAGIITYKSAARSTPYSFYRSVASKKGELAPPYRTNHTLTEQVTLLLSDTKDAATAEEIYTALLVKHPTYQDKDKKALTNRISNVLAHLTREGYAEHEGMNPTMLSSITLSDDQRETLLAFVAMIEKFRTLDPTFLAEGRREAHAIITTRDRFATLMEKAYQASPHVQRTTRVETETRIISFLQETPGSTTAEIRNHLLRKYNQKLSPVHITTIIRNIRKLKNSSIITADQETKAVRRYSLVEVLPTTPEETVIYTPTPKEKDNIAAFKENYIENERNRLFLLRGITKFGILQNAKKEIAMLTSSDMFHLVAMLITVLGQDKTANDVDKRDSAYELLLTINFDAIDPQELQNVYLNAVSDLDETADPFGSINSLLDAGILLAPELPQTIDTIIAIDKAWKAAEINPWPEEITNKVRQIGDEIITIYIDSLEKDANEKACIRSIITLIRNTSLADKQLLTQPTTNIELQQQEAQGEQENSLEETHINFSRSENSLFDRVIKIFDGDTENVTLEELSVIITAIETVAEERTLVASLKSTRRGKVIKWAREYKGLSLKKVADALEIKLRTLDQIEQGKRALSLSELRSTIALLNVSPEFDEKMDKITTKIEGEASSTKFIYQKRIEGVGRLLVEVSNEVGISQRDLSQIINKSENMVSLIAKNTFRISIEDAEKILTEVQQRRHAINDAIMLLETDLAAMEESLSGA
ncbi:MAG TPA: helix-turn-helix transcriptional regulator [Candidatus Sulfotelmatobacter sp.]|jgi:transcriptional regulator with XRE-family HTH domain|nr:helix-turn-helix transcriptional regulator [Candidatus Sulfotelmatobacter sp.]